MNAKNTKVFFERILRLKINKFISTPYLHRAIIKGVQKQFDIISFQSFKNFCAVSLYNGEATLIKFTIGVIQDILHILHFFRFFISNQPLEIIISHLNQKHGFIIAKILFFIPNPEWFQNIFLFLKRLFLLFHQLPLLLLIILYHY